MVAQHRAHVSGGHRRLTSYLTNSWWLLPSKPDYFLSRIVNLMFRRKPAKKKGRIPARSHQNFSTFYIINVKGHKCSTINLFDLVMNIQPGIVNLLKPTFLFFFLSSLLVNLLSLPPAKGGIHP